MKLERRFMAELRVDSQGDEMSLVGYASKFNKQSQDLGGFRETVMPGAFARSLRDGADVKFLMNHDPSLIMGRTKSGTLKLSEDGVGLRFRVALPDTQAARDLYALVKRGDLDQCSFAFTAKDQSWEDERDENGDLYASRKLMDVDLMDVSAVTYPAYLDTAVSADSRVLFPEGMPAEVRAAMESVAACRSADEEDPGLTAAKSADTEDEHSKAAAFHKKQAASAKKAGDSGKALAHTTAASSHDEAAKAQKDAFSKAAKAGQDGATEADKSAAAQAMHYSSKATQQAQGHSSETAWRSRERRGSENQPGSGSPEDVSWPQGPMREDWWDAFKDSFDGLMKKGGKGYAVKQALAKAIAAANMKVQPQTEVDPEVSGQGKDPSEVPHEVVDTSAEDLERSRKMMEVRYSEGSFEDQIEDLNCAVEEKFGTGGYGFRRYYVVETFPDHVIVCDSFEQCYYSVDYTCDGDDCELGDLVPVEQQYVPTERMVRAAESRVYKTVADVPDKVPSDKKKQWMEVWNSAYKKAKKDKMSDDDAESSAFAQANGVIKKESNSRSRADEVSDPDSPDYDPEDPEYDESLDDSPEDDGEDEDRDGAKTKTVSGEALHASDFAFVGDAQDPSTWKLPVHDKSHAQNALARFNQTKGIPADQKEAVYKKIVAACKKFGITVSEEDSMRCGVPHSVAVAVLGEPDPIEESLRRQLMARVRMIEIDLE